MSTRAIILCVLLASFAPMVFGRDGSPSGSASPGCDSSSVQSDAVDGGSSHDSQHRTVAARDDHGKIKRRQQAVKEFKRSHPCPSTGKTSGSCPGYDVDHKDPLACGGADDPSNMQWLPKAENRHRSAMGCRLR